MLDIYYADASITVMPEDPGELEFAGSIDVEAHRSVALLIDRSGQADIRFRYFEDSLLTAAQVVSLLEIVVANADEREGDGQASAALATMRGILERAVSEGLGLVAFGD
ncbi:hypothetical protein KK141_06595 [Dyella sp. LX-66]|uniref:hypothetical protein n=1 Tax=unclassified Dyella TaxID=2634549 RepID=UPI001BDFF799|nr:MULTISPECIES: hypothetical protein [unclassified Dyella]MBT2116626.1 hypothetical protein [Dyella sp. LX-1]MBT2139194.1 hypothetical protein [Dyella sp. LX-66]